ncbi:MAG: cupin domain-containing protein [Spirochaetales bacterium]|nr:cupin domain-containing protein [Spirochaetales bacterium]
MAIKNFYSEKHNQKSIHGGTGLLQDLVLFDKKDFETNLSFISHTVLPPGTSIGYHSHHSEREEVYVILKGTGLYTQAGELSKIRSGDVLITGINQSHGLENNSDSDLELFIFWVRK